MHSQQQPGVGLFFHESHGKIKARHHERRADNTPLARLPPPLSDSWLRTTRFQISVILCRRDDKWKSEVVKAEQVKTIVSGGSAERDGRIQVGDTL